MKAICRRLCTGVALLIGSSAAAADKGDLGLDLEVGSQRLIGLTYHVSGRLALRPGVFFQNVRSENTPTLLDPTLEAPVYETEETAFGGRLQADYFLPSRRGVSPYVGLTMSYSHLNAPYPVSNAGNVIFRTGNLHGWSSGAAFGAQYAVSEVFQVYGQVGLTYTSTERFTLNGRKLRSRSWSTSTSSIGLVVYLN